MRLSIPNSLFRSPHSLLILSSFSRRLAFPSSPLLMSLVISLTSTSYVEAKAREGHHEAAYKGRDACESKEGAEEAKDAWQTLKEVELRRPARHGRLLWRTSLRRIAATLWLEKAKAWEALMEKAKDVSSFFASISSPLATARHRDVGFLFPGKEAWVCRADDLACRWAPLASLERDLLARWRWGPLGGCDDAA